jgi:antagonist of KipI
MAGIRVIRPGLQTTVQDSGRWGWQAQGVPVAGPMDPRSFRVANALVGNAPGTSALEITMLGPDITFDDERVVAVAGAEFRVTLDGTAAAIGRPFLVGPGSRLSMGGRSKGVRAYLGISGGIAVAPVFGSRSTHVPSRLGGVDGRALRAGDWLPLGDMASGIGPLFERAGRAHAKWLESGHAVSVPDRHARIRVLPGPQGDRFTAAAFDLLQSAPFSIGPDSDRMALRLRGPSLGHRGSADIISDATPLGALQVPASGQPILLLADRQTTGGYPKIAIAITADIGLAGQLAAGDSISFEVCTPRTALAALITQERLLMDLEARAQS